MEVVDDESDPAGFAEPSVNRMQDDAAERPATGSLSQSGIVLAITIGSLECMTMTVPMGLSWMVIER